VFSLVRFTPLQGCRDEIAQWLPPSHQPGCLLNQAAYRKLSTRLEPNSSSVVAQGFRNAEASAAVSRMNHQQCAFKCGCQRIGRPTAVAVASFRSCQNSRPARSGPNSPASSRRPPPALARGSTNQLFGDCADHHRSAPCIPLVPITMRPAPVLAGHVHKHLGDSALANLRMAVNPLAQQVAASLSSTSRAASGKPLRTRRNSTTSAYSIGSSPCARTIPRPIIRGQFAAYSRAAQTGRSVRGHHNGLQAGCETHGCLLTQGATKSSSLIPSLRPRSRCKQ